jgi:uncharacterized Zn-binding protein involved in type VI secretion
MKHEGRGVIRVNDKTDHGGWVIAASSGTVVLGKLAALADDMTYCPKCKGQFAIKPDGKGARHQGRAYAYHGDVTECGARLLASLELTPSNTSSLAESDAKQAEAGLPDPVFDDRFVLLDDETGEPAAFTEYAVERENGTIEHGVTNERGETHVVSATTKPEEIKIYIAVDI